MGVVVVLLVVLFVLSMWICSIKSVSLSHIASYSVCLDISSTVMSLGQFALKLTLAYVSGKNYHVMQGKGVMCCMVKDSVHIHKRIDL